MNGKVPIPPSIFFFFLTYITLYTKRNVAAAVPNASASIDEIKNNRRGRVIFSPRYTKMSAHENKIQHQPHHLSRDRYSSSQIYPIKRATHKTNRVELRTRHHEYRRAYLAHLLSQSSSPTLSPPTAPVGNSWQKKNTLSLYLSLLSPAHERPSTHRHLPRILTKNMLAGVEEKPLSRNTPSYHTHRTAAARLRHIFSIRAT